MLELIRSKPVEIITIGGFSIAAVLYALHKLGWLRMGKQAQEWNGNERRECAHHSGLAQKVCSLYTKLEDVDKKLDVVAEKLQYVLGALENRWGKRT